MERQSPYIDHRKTKRRRAERPAISARIIFTTDKFKSDVGRISDDLFDDLFLHLPLKDRPTSKTNNVQYIAITPWAPNTSELIADGAWTILPVTVQNSDEENESKLPPASVKFSISSPSLQSFVRSVDGFPSIQETFKGKLDVEIRVLDVEPFDLSTVFITIDGNALSKHDEVQRKFGGGFDYSSTNGYSYKGKEKRKASQIKNLVRSKLVPDDQQQRLIDGIRKALAMLTVIRQGELLFLPLPAHPITHVPFPPAKISFCEPCNQGLLCRDTKVIVNRTFAKRHGGRSLPSLASQAFLNGAMMEGDETSSEPFFSALEDTNAARPASSGTEAESSDSNSSERDSDSLSDDSLENVITISSPGLPPDSSGVQKSTAAITPRAVNLKSSGFNTPGSVRSSFTSRTARQGTVGNGMLFQVRSLLKKVSDDTIFPKPFNDEDDQARVFINTKLLLKLGCFSGDWVKVEGIVASSTHENHWGIEALPSDDAFDGNFRVLKIYGLPDIQPNTKARHLKGRAVRKGLKALYEPFKGRPVPDAWFSPILFANLGQPSIVRLSPLSGTCSRMKQDSASLVHKIGDTKLLASFLPPIAKEVILLRISTPLVTERALQKGLHVALQKYFESKRRILRQGDLVPLVIDVGTSKILGQFSASSDADQAIEELLSFSYDQVDKIHSIGVAWFKVKKVVESKDEEDFPFSSSSVWGGLVCVEPSITRTVQAQGNEQSKIPSSLDNPWEYYLGIKALPKSGLQDNGLRSILSKAPRPHVSLLRRRLRELIATGSSNRAVSLGMKPMVILLHSSQRGIGKATVTVRASSDLGNHVFPIDAYELLSEGGSGGGDYKTEEIFKNQTERALSCGSKFTTILIRHIEAMTADRMISALNTLIKSVRVLVATTSELEKVADGMRSLFTHELHFEVPNEQEREGNLREIVEEKGIRLAHDVDLAAIAIKTAALVAGDLVDIVERAIVARQARLEALIQKSSSNAKGSSNLLLRDLLVSGGESARCVTKADFDIAVDAARKNFADSIGAPKIPNVSWEDVGGLENVKDAVMETIQLPLERPELFAKGMKKRSGILFYGPPGTGKTLLAKAIATEFSLNFFSVKGPELLNMYIGESEANVRRVFQKARDAKPCVVFFDELDSVAPKRGNQGDSGGVMDRIVSQLLAELDGMSDGEDGGGGVFVIGATNRPDLLDQALLRPGRFDKMLYLGVSDTHEKQLTIIQALTRKFTMDADLSLQRIAASLPFTYTGADLYALCSDAMLKAITRQTSAVDAKIKALPGAPITTAYFFDHLATKDDIAVTVTEIDFLAAQRELVGSVR